MKHLPRDTEICGRQWRICYADRLIQDGREVYGFSDTDERTIYVARTVDGKRLSHKELRLTITHETAHAKLHEIGEAFAEAYELARRARS